MHVYKGNNSFVYIFFFVTFFFSQISFEQVSDWEIFIEKLGKKLTFCHWEPDQLPAIKMTPKKTNVYTITWSHDQDSRR